MDYFTDDLMPDDMYNPANLELSHEKMQRLCPELFRVNGTIKLFYRWLYDMVAESLRIGDCNPAMVISLSPLMISAYAYDLDAVVMLKFPDELTVMYQLEPGTRLLSANTYTEDQLGQTDLIIGPKGTSVFQGFQPVIADFLVDDQVKLDWRKMTIKESDWERLSLLTQAYQKAKPGIYRSGLPTESMNAYANFEEKINAQQKELFIQYQADVKAHKIFSDEYTPVIETADRLFRKKRYLEAIPYYEKFYYACLETISWMHPRDWNFMVKACVDDLSDCYYFTGDYSKARKISEQALQYGKKPKPLHIFRIAECYLLQGDECLGKEWLIEYYMNAYDAREYADINGFKKQWKQYAPLIKEEIAEIKRQKRERFFSFFRRN